MTFSAGATTESVEVKIEKERPLSSTADACAPEFPTAIVLLNSSLATGSTPARPAFRQEEEDAAKLWMLSPEVVCLIVDGLSEEVAASVFPTISKVADLGRILILPLAAFGANEGEIDKAGFQSS